MPKTALAMCIGLGSLGCVAPKPIVATPDPGPLQAEVAELKEQVAQLQRQVGHLQSEVSASSAENELTEMTIDSVVWADESIVRGVAWDDLTLVCHVREWRDFGKMLRFTRKADQVFVLEAEGQPQVHAHSGEGGICNDDGSIRFVILRLTEELAPKVAYRLRPQNTKENYRWSVQDGLVVLGR